MCHIRQVRQKRANSNGVSLVSRTNNDDFLIENHLKTLLCHNEPENSQTDESNDCNFLIMDDEYFDGNHDINYHVYKMLAHPRVFTNSTGRNIANVMNLSEIMLVNVSKFLKAQLKYFLIKHIFFRAMKMSKNC